MAEIDTNCQAITKKGTRCTFKASCKPNEDHRYCSRFHQKFSTNPILGKDVIPIVDTVSDLLTKSPDRSVWSVLLEQNHHDRELVDRLINGEITKKQYKDMISERLQGQWQFSMKSYNIRDPKFLCKHACSYCYIGPMFARFGRHCQTVEIEDSMPTDAKLINHNWSKVSDQNQREMIFFPSSSDIFEENAVDYVKVCKKIIDAGHEIMYATKPTMKSITAVIGEFEKFEPSYKSKLVIFIAVTTDDDKVLRMYEPYTSLFGERVEVIKFLVARGYNVNVFVEPYLSNPISIIDQLLPIIGKGIIAVGGMNYTKNIKFCEDQIKNSELISYLDQLYNPENIKQLYQYVKIHSNVFMKKHTIEQVIKAFN